MAATSTYHDSYDKRWCAGHQHPQLYDSAAGAAALLSRDGKSFVLCGVQGQWWYKASRRR